VGEERMDNEGFLPGYTIPRVEPVVDNKEKRPRLRPVDRRQMILHPIGSSSAHSTLRFTYEDIDSREGDAGAPAFDPRLLVNLWVYAYSKGVSSAREISRL